MLDGLFIYISYSSSVITKNIGFMFQMQCQVFMEKNPTDHKDGNMTHRLA